MRFTIMALAATGLVACIDAGPNAETIVVPAPAPVVIPPRVNAVPAPPPVTAAPLPPSGGTSAPVPVDPVIQSAAPVSPDPERSGCLITYDDGTQAVQRRTEDGMQQTPADFLDPALVAGLSDC